MSKFGYILIGVLVVVLIAVGYFNSRQSVADPAPQQVEEIETNETASTESSTTQVSSSTASEMLSQEGEQQAEDYSGVHIMPDGTIMKADGTVLAGAKVLANGKIQLSDGSVITPAADMRSSSQGSSSDPGPNEVTFNVSGVDFAYDVKEIRVKKGDVVTINFKSNQGFHDWVVDEFNAATERVNDEGTTSVTFVADKVGTFQYYCSVMNHRQKGMIGYLIVE